MTTQPKAAQLKLFGTHVERDRQSLLVSLNSAIASVDSNHHLVLITIDVRGFKDINMLFGFDNGDAVLKTIAHRLLKLLRPKDVLYRTGDDEFSILLNPVLHRDHALLAVHRIHCLFERPVTIDEAEHMISISIGLSAYPDTATNAEDLIKQSVMASNQAKLEHGEFVFYEPGQGTESQQQQVLSQQIKEALYSGQLELLYQPIFDPQDKHIVGVEGLARWMRGENDAVLAGEFIPAVEQTGLMQSFTQWVLNTALRECAGFPGLFITVNISATNLEDKEFPDLVKRALSTWGVTPNRLILEVTETTLMSNLECTRFVLDRLYNTGILLAIDDFGSGYSSLKYIRELPVSYLKIDSSFVEGLRADCKDKMIVDAICKLGHSFGLKVIAEGVSTEVSRKIAIELGCDLMQGFYLAQPLAPIQLQEALRARPRETGRKIYMTA